MRTKPSFEVQLQKLSRSLVLDALDHFPEYDDGAIASLLPDPVRDSLLRELISYYRDFPRPARRTSVHVP